MFKKAAVFTDLHAGLKGNSFVHNQDCEEFIEWFIDQAHRNNCETAVFCGDFHHNRNSVNVATLNSSIRMLERLGSEFENFFMFDGNHDLYYKDRRTLNSTAYARHIPGVTMIDNIHVEDGVCMVPWLVGDEWKKVREIKSQYMFGHFELPSFYMNAMVRMPDHGELKAEHFKHQDYVFSGHFHKRQQQGKIHYIGNAFPHNYADAWDDSRGMMILDKENNKPPVYLNWDNAPKYRTIELSSLLEKTSDIILPKMHLRVSLDIDISFEEATYIKETFMEQYKCREIKLIPQKHIEEIDSDLDVSTFSSVNEIVSTEISELDTEKFDKSTLMSIYNGLS